MCRVLAPALSEEAAMVYNGNYESRPGQVDKWTDDRHFTFNTNTNVLAQSWLLFYTRGYKHKIFIVVSHNLNLV